MGYLVASAPVAPADATSALQSFLITLGQTGGTGIIPPGIYLTTDELCFSLQSGIQSVQLLAYGAVIISPSLNTGAFKIQNVVSKNRLDEARKTVVRGLTIDHYQNPNPKWGIRIIGTPFVCFEDVSVLAGSDTPSLANVPDYEAIYIGPTDLANDDTGSFWCEMNRPIIRGGSCSLPFGIVLQGQQNDFRLIGGAISGVSKGVTFRPSGTGAIANSVHIDGTAFEGVDNVWWADQVTPGNNTFLYNFKMHDCRFETIRNFVFDYTVLPQAGFYPTWGPPVLGPNDLSVESWGKYWRTSSSTTMPIYVMDPGPPR